MPTVSTISTSSEQKGRKVERKYQITFIDDPPERAEAVRFFGRALFPAVHIPEFTFEMSAADAQAYFDQHPMHRRWTMLTLNSREVSFEDKDLYRLGFLPELERLHSHAGHLTDRGVAHFRLIPKLRHLVIYSPLITDACLEDIASLRHLQTIDLQGSHLITHRAFNRLVENLPELVDIYPPFHRTQAKKTWWGRLFSNNRDA